MRKQRTCVPLCSSLHRQTGLPKNPNPHTHFSAPDPAPPPPPSTVKPNPPLQRYLSTNTTIIRAFSVCRITARRKKVWCPPGNGLL